MTEILRSFSRRWRKNYSSTQAKEIFVPEYGYTHIHVDVNDSGGSSFGSSPPLYNSLSGLCISTVVLLVLFCKNNVFLVYPSRMLYFQKYVLWNRFTITVHLRRVSWSKWLNLIRRLALRNVPLSSGGFKGRLRGKVTVVSAVLAAIVSTGAELGRGMPVPPDGRLIYAVVVSDDLLLASSSWNWSTVF